IVSVLLLSSMLKSLSVHLPLLAIAFSISARMIAGAPFEIAASCALRQAFCVIVCPLTAITVFSQLPIRILTWECRVVAALSVRHITAGRSLFSIALFEVLFSRFLYGTVVD